jgi:CubicO group peptidase (beta-lactamase class C family)
MGYLRFVKTLSQIRLHAISKDTRPLTTNEQLDAIQAYVAEAAIKHQIPGLALGVARAGEPLLLEGFGYRDVARQLLVTADTIFGLASITKSFTAVTIMRLQELGKLTVHDPVVRYLPTFTTPDPEATQQITLHHLLTHTAGIPPLPSRYFAFVHTMKGDPAAFDTPVDVDSYPPIETFDDLIAYIAQHEFQLLGQPGEHFSYSNEGYGLLGGVVEAVTGKPFAEVVSEHVLEPAGMRRSTFDVEAVVADENATLPYARLRPGEDAPVEASLPWWHCYVWLPAGCLYSTVNDLLRYLEIYRTGGMVGGVRVLSKASVEAMIHPWALNTPGDYYGYGLAIRPDFPGGPLVSHGGGRKGIATEIVLAKQDGTTAVVLANLADVPVEKVARAAVNLAADRPAEAGKLVYPRAAVHESPEAIAGLYRSGEGAELTVTAENGRLLASFGEEQIVLEPTQDGFVAPLRGEETFVRVVRNQRGEVRALGFGSRLIPRVS